MKKKSISIVIGSKAQIEETKAKLKESPLMSGEVEVKTKEANKWLGQQLTEGGLADSVDATVTAREAKIKGASMEILSIVRDWRTEVVGGMETALLLWEACVVPSLLHGSGTWKNITARTEKRMNSLQHWFTRLVLQLGPGAPLAALSWDTGLIDMKLRVWREKLFMVLHLRSLCENSLASKVYREQLDRGWPGLSQEVKLICNKLEIEDCNTTKINKKEFKKIINEAIIKKNEEEIKIHAQGKTKCERIFSEKYGRKEYLGQKKIGEVREYFRSRFGLQPFAGNYSNDKRFSRTGWLCRCGVKEVEGHLATCQVYDDITARYTNLKEDGQLVSYYREVLERRTLLDDQEREEQETRDQALVVEPSITTDVCQYLRTGQSSQGCGVMD